MNQDEAKMREEFESWWRQACKNPEFGGRGEWLAWQAAHASAQKEIDRREFEVSEYVSCKEQQILEQQKEIDSLRHERNVLQKICAERSDEILQLSAQLEIARKGVR